MNALDQLKAQTQNALSALRLPTHPELEAYISKTIQCPGSCTVFVIEDPLNPDGPRIGRCWLSPKEREKLRKALTTINTARKAKGEPLTSHPPNAT